MMLIGQYARQMKGQPKLLLVCTIRVAKQLTSVDWSASQLLVCESIQSSYNSLISSSNETVVSIFFIATVPVSW